MTDHFDDHHTFDDHHEPLPFDDPAGHDDIPLLDHDDHDAYDDHAGYGGHEDEPWEPPPAQPHDAGIDDVPPDEPADIAQEPDVFPPPLDVGELPEPVDGFPWIDTTALGGADMPADHLDPVRPAELAEYAGQDIAPGADGWQTLKDSDDPATAALARWWTQS